jgi:hypothetical protein
MERNEQCKTEAEYDYGDYEMGISKDGFSFV